MSEQTRPLWGIVLGLMIITVVGVLFVYGQRQRLAQQQEDAAAADASVELPPEPLVIGGIVPLTGAEQSRGLEIQKAALLALADINKDGGIAERPVEIIWKDGKCAAGPAVTAAQELVTIDEVSYIMGPVCNDEADAVARIASTNKILTFSPSANRANLTELGAPYFFRTAQSETVPAQAAAEFLVSEKKVQSVALLANDDDSSRLWKDTFVATLKEKQIAVVSNKILPGDDTELTPQEAQEYADELKSLERPPEALLAAVSSAESLSNLMEALADADISIPVVTPHENITTLLESVEDEKEVEIYSTIHTTVSFFNEDSRDYKKFLKIYSDEAGTPPTAAWEAAHMYSQLFLLKQLIEDLGDDTSEIASKLRDGEIKNWKHSLGTLSITPSGDRAGRATIMKVEEGSLKNIAVHELNQ